MVATIARNARRYAPLAVLAAIGPGLVTASAGNDAGGISTYSVAGADFDGTLPAWAERLAREAGLFLWARE